MSPTGMGKTAADRLQAVRDRFAGLMFRPPYAARHVAGMTIPVDGGTQAPFFAPGSP